MNDQVEKYLITGDRPLIVLPELVKEIGLEPAIILQQLHWLLRDERNGKMIGNRRWIFNTYQGWQVYFGWMSERTLMKHFLSLEEMGLIESCQPDGSHRRKYYTISVGRLAGQW